MKKVGIPIPSRTFEQGFLIEFGYEKDSCSSDHGLTFIDCGCAGIIGCSKGGGVVQEGGADQYYGWI